MKNLDIMEDKKEYTLQVITTNSNEKYEGVERHEVHEFGGYSVWFADGNTMHIGQENFILWRTIKP